MAIANISNVFSGATVSSFALTIPSGSLVSCTNPVATDPNEIIFGMLENIYQAVSSGDPTYIQTNVSSSLVGTDTYRRVYSFTVDLDFDGSAVIADLDVKPNT